MTDEQNYQAELKKYADLLQSFLTDTICRQQFERSYLQMFKAESCFFDDDVFFALDGLFAALDDYPPTKTDSSQGNNEAVLRCTCANTLAIIQANLASRL